MFPPSLSRLLSRDVARLSTFLTYGVSSSVREFFKFDLNNDLFEFEDALGEMSFLIVEVFGKMVV